LSVCNGTAIFFSELNEFSEWKAKSKLPVGAVAWTQSLQMMVNHSHGSDNVTQGKLFILFLYVNIK